MSTQGGQSVKNEDYWALRNYVTAKDTTQFANVGASTLVLDLTHSNLVQRHAEIRFDQHDRLSDLRQRIYQKTGTPPHFQHLQIYSGPVVLYEIDPNSVDHKLGYFSLQHGMRVHCVDVNPHSQSANGQFEDVSLVEKYKMSDQDYNQRTNTLRHWSRQEQAKDPNFSLVFGPHSVKGMQVDQRCSVQPGGRRGRIAYIGQVPEIGPGHWVGVVFDEPVGKSDGSLKGKRYFQAAMKYGGFVRGKHVQTGDFPPLDDLEDEFTDDDEEDEL